MNELKISTRPYVFVDEYNALINIIESVVNKISTVELVRVEKVNSDNTIDVIPIVKNANAENNPIPESVIYGIRYFQWQYGTNAIKATPAIGDIGLIVVCKKDISEAEKGLVGSFRKFNMADGIYIGGIFGLNQTPTQYIDFGENGISITSTGSVEVNAQTANINATAINLGGTGGQPVARVGDNVVSGTTVIGQIGAGSSIVKAV